MHIKPRKTVILDVDTPVLTLILIEGSLIFYDEQDVHFQAKYIFVNGGQLQAKSLSLSLSLFKCQFFFRLVLKKSHFVVELL